MEIKICGIRRKEDINIINKYKPDYIGFIFAKTRRYINPSEAGSLAAMLSGDIKTVGVFVNETPEKVNEIADIAGLDIIQLHGDEDSEYIKRLGNRREIWKAIRVRKNDPIIEADGADKLLLDKYDDSEYGGTGKRFDWNTGIEKRLGKPLILAGGLDKDNVREGIEIFNPVCVDVSSSVETDGYKDERKIKEFIEAVRRIDNEQNRREI